MKNLKIIFRKQLLIIMIMVIFLGFTNSVSSRMSKDGKDIVRMNNTELMYENIILRKEYINLSNKLVEMETLVKKIHKYDNIIYSQYLGVDFDTTGYSNYKNDSIKNLIKQNDTIFGNVNDRAFYATELLAIQLIKLQETSNRFKNNKNAILYYPTISPIKTKDFIELTSPYGWRKHPIIGNKLLFHEGVDIAAKPKTPVYSTAQGKIVKILYSKYGYGNRIVIKHAYGFETLYAHLGVIKVKKGQWVNKNQLIGTVGNTGLSTGTHLHYEIRKNGEPRDPLGYFYTHLTEELYVMK